MRFPRALSLFSIMLAFSHVSCPHLVGYLSFLAPFSSRVPFESALLSVIDHSPPRYLAAFRYWFSSCVPTNMSLQLIRRCGSTAERPNAIVAGWFVKSALRAARNTENGGLPGLGREVF